MNEIRVSAVVMQDPDGRVLHVRKRGTAKLMLPGGKPEPSEDPAACALREFEEELGLRLDPAELRHVGEFRAAAANEADHVVVASVFAHPWRSGVRASGEISAIEWIPASSRRDDLAPLSTQWVLPAVERGNPATTGDSA